MHIFSFHTSLHFLLPFFGFVNLRMWKGRYSNQPQTELNFPILSIRIFVFVFFAKPVLTLVHSIYSQPSIMNKLTYFVFHEQLVHQFFGIFIVNFGRKKFPLRNSFNITFGETIWKQKLQERSFLMFYSRLISTCFWIIFLHDTWNWPTSCFSRHVFLHMTFFLFVWTCELFLFCSSLFWRYRHSLW